MLRHVLKLIWKRKGRHTLVSLEIMIAFAIVFATTAIAARYAQIHAHPLGFDYQDVWTVELKAPVNERTSYNAQLFDQLQRGLAALPEISQISFGTSAPFIERKMESGFAHPETGRRMQSEMIDVSDSFFGALSIDPVAGRVFDQRDNGAAAQAVVINRLMARELFGDDNAVGRRFTQDRRGHPPHQMEVVGVIDTFRRLGELAAPRTLVLARDSMVKAESTMEMMILKLAPGTARQFEEKLHARLKQIRRDWEYEITPLARARETAMRNALTPLTIVATIAAFMLLMVAVGLFGVLWQNVTIRIPEIGLRRALGASAGDIYRQIVIEQLTMSSSAMLAALILLVQLPVTGVFGDSLNWTVFGVAAVASMAVIYLLSLLCSLYPGWRASRLTPTEALHYE